MSTKVGEIFESAPGVGIKADHEDAGHLEINCGTDSPSSTIVGVDAVASHSSESGTHAAAANAMAFAPSTAAARRGAARSRCGTARDLATSVGTPSSTMSSEWAGPFAWPAASNASIKHRRPDGPRRAVDGDQSCTLVAAADLVVAPHGRHLVLAISRHRINSVLGALQWLLP